MSQQHLVIANTWRVLMCKFCWSQQSALNSSVDGSTVSASGLSIRSLLLAAFVVLAGCSGGGGASPLSTGSAGGNSAASIAQRSELAGSIEAATPSYTILHRFRGGSDGAAPLEPTLIAVDGNLFGTTLLGGKTNRGTVFEVTPSGAESVLYSFAGPDGAEPAMGLVNVNGTLLGTTLAGGSQGAGVLFGITVSGAESVLHNFGLGLDAAYPQSNLLQVHYALYGTSQFGGKRGFGAVFQADSNGNERVYYSFTGNAFTGNADGAYPVTGLIDVNGTLYGTTEFGGGACSVETIGCGTVFSIDPSGVETVLHRFGSGQDGMYPNALIDVDGALYGTTAAGGTYGLGTVFKMSPSGSETILHDFSGADGSGPVAGLTNLNGSLYGTTTSGGLANGGGVLFSITLDGKVNILHDFGRGTDGAQPWGGLFPLNGTLYGTTEVGGGEPDCGCGIVFSLKPAS
jgi:uncharacterized repeat protein (TIGR03803 family)